MNDDRIILCYHALSEDWPAATAVTPADFRGQLAVLARRGYRGVTFSAALDPLTRGKVVAVTFDDAHASITRHAHPILAEQGWPATVFVPTRYPDSGEAMTWRGNELWTETPWADELGCMSWEDVGGLDRAGWEIGSHTRSHPVLTELGDSEVAEELETSRTEVTERVGRPCRTIAYPYGIVDPRIAAAARAAGYAAGATTLGNPHVPDAMTVPRLVVSRTDRVRRFALKTLPPMRRALADPRVARAKAWLQAEAS